jgi:hypothetical protein
MGLWRNDSEDAGLVRLGIFSSGLVAYRNLTYCLLDRYGIYGFFNIPAKVNVVS